jgi:hypothetical protein
MNFRKTMLAVAVFSIAGHAQAVSWQAHETSAVTFFENGIAVFVDFPPFAKCDDAILGIIGNEDIERMGMVVDEKVFALTETTNVDRIAMVTLSDGALRSLKNGRKAFIVTEQGSLPIDLTGSSAAINKAYQGCLDALSPEPAVKILQPSPRRTML